MKLFTKQKQPQIQRTHVWLPGGGMSVREGYMGVFGSTCNKLLYLKQITSKDLLYNTGKSASTFCNELNGRRF